MNCSVPSSTSQPTASSDELRLSVAAETAAGLVHVPAPAPVCAATREPDHEQAHGLDVQMISIKIDQKIDEGVAMQLHAANPPEVVREPHALNRRLPGDFS